MSKYVCVKCGYGLESGSLVHMNNTTVEVPIAWLEKLIQLGKKADAKVYWVGVNGSRVDKTSIEQLKGYIESAETLINRGQGSTTI